MKSLNNSPPLNLPLAHLPLAVLLLVLFLSSCENFWEPRSVVTNLPEHEPVLVINGFIHPDSVFQVSVSKSRGFLSSYENPFITRANVTILESGNSVAELFHTRDGYYKAAVKKPRIGATYELQVSADSFKPVAATATIPKPIKIDSVDFREDRNLGFEIDVTVYFQDPPNEDNYYQLLILTRDRFSGDQNLLEPIGFSSSDAVLRKPDDFEDKSYYYDDAFFDDALFDGEFYDLDISYDNYYDDVPELFLLLLTTSEAYYNFRKSVEQQQQTEDNPFAEPVPVFTNIDQGLGIFAAYSSFIYRMK